MKIGVIFLFSNSVLPHKVEMKYQFPYRIITIFKFI